MAKETAPPCIIGIDPGLAHCGYGVISSDSARHRLLDCGEVRTAAGEAPALRLRRIYDQLSAVFACYRPSACAVETLYLNKNSSSALPVAQARGVALLCAAQSAATVYEFGANRIKQAVTGQGKAAKEQVQQMVALLLGLQNAEKQPLLRSNHAADALAAALCLAYQQGGEGWNEGTSSAQSKPVQEIPKIPKIPKIPEGQEFAQLIQQALARQGQDGVRR